MPPAEPFRSRVRTSVIALVGVLAFLAACFASGLAPAPARAAAGDVVIPPGDLAITFVARVCTEYTDIMANRARNNIMESLRDLGMDTVYTAGQAISPTIEEPNQPNCRPLRNWNFQMGTGFVGKTEATNFLSTVSNPYSTSIVTGRPIPELNAAGVDTGRTIDGAVTVVLTPAQAQQAQQANALWVQGGTVAQTLPPSGEWGFGALRCAVDNLNGDNVEYVSYPQAARHVFCYYFAVSPPPEAGAITVVKQLAPGSLGSGTFPFEGNISYDKPTEDAPGTFSLVASAATPGSVTFIRGEVLDGDPPWNFKENVPSGWELAEEPSCTTELGSPWSYDPDDGINVALLAGDQVVCTFTNERELTGAAFLYKQTIGGTGAFPFTIDVPDPGTDVDTTVVVPEPDQLTEVASTAGSIPGTYTATETLPTVTYGTWDLDSVLCDAGDTVLDVPFASSGQQRTANVTIPVGGQYSCLFTNRFTSDGEIAIRKKSIAGIGVFNYSIVPDRGSTTQQYLSRATTTTPGEFFDAAPLEGSEPAVNLPIDSTWEVQEFLPAPTEQGFWRVVAADCGEGLRGQRLPDAVVEVRITAANPRVQCSFTNQFVTLGSLEVVKNTSSAEQLRPDDALLEWSCDDGTSGDLVVASKRASATTGVIDTRGFLQCTVSESQTGAADDVKVTTTASINVNGASVAYVLGDPFLVQPEDEVVVTVDNAFEAILPATGAAVDVRMPLAAGIATTLLGGALLIGKELRRRRRT